MPTLPILIAGATASGKSALALKISQSLDGIVINADALQIYQEWQILTARPHLSDHALCPHLLYGHVGACEDYSVGKWLNDIVQIQQKYPDKPLIIIGGTGLYFHALTQGLAQIPDIDLEVRNFEISLDDMIDYLDLPTRKFIDLNNPRRVRRAWEVQYATGKSLATWHKQTPPPVVKQAVKLLLSPNRDMLYKRADARFDMMIERGVLKEVEAFLALDLPLNCPASKAIGCRELSSFLQDRLTLDEAVSLAKIATRHYIKRQETWFKSRMKDWKSLKGDDFCNFEQEIQDLALLSIDKG